MSTQTQGPPLTSKALALLFRFSYGVFRQNTEGITHEESLRQPSPGGNCINWVGGHLCATRQGMLELLGHESTWTPAERERYKRGSVPMTAIEVLTLPWERIAADFDAAQPVLLSALETMTPEQLLAPLPKEQNPFRVDCLAEQLALFHFHETYHAGQLGLLRRLAGKKGAIA